MTNDVADLLLKQAFQNTKSAGVWADLGCGKGFFTEALARQLAPPDVIIIGAGLSGLVAANELAENGKRVILIDQEGEQNLGGQAFWSFGGLFFIDSPLQRRMGIKDSLELASNDWFGTAGFDRPEDHWPKKWAEAYLHFAATEKYSWLKEKGLKFFPVVGWAERGGYGAIGTATLFRVFMSPGELVRE
ncbi:hypothetical protein OSTOST_14143 [Ostertagia ostertagi]